MSFRTFTYVCREGHELITIESGDAVHPPAMLCDSCRLTAVATQTGPALPEKEWYLTDTKYPVTKLRPLGIADQEYYDRELKEIGKARLAHITGLSYGKQAQDDEAHFLEMEREHESLNEWNGRLELGSLTPEDEPGEVVPSVDRLSCAQLVELLGNVQRRLWLFQPGT